MSRNRAIAEVVACCVAVGCFAPAPAHAQLTDPCATLCGATLVGVGAVVATGTAVSVARLKGGFSTTSQGLWTWGSSFALTLGGGLLIDGDGELQERAVYSAAAGSAIGAALGLALAEFTDTNERGRSLAHALIGAGAGALVSAFGTLLLDGPKPVAVGLAFGR